MNADKLLKAIRSAEEMCYAVIDFCHGNEDLLPKKHFKSYVQEMYSIMDGLLFEYTDFVLHNEGDVSQYELDAIHKHAVSVLREASSTLAKLKALVSAKIQLN